METHSDHAQESEIREAGPYSDAEDVHAENSREEFGLVRAVSAILLETATVAAPLMMIDVEDLCQRNLVEGLFVLYPGSACREFAVHRRIQEAAG